MTAAGVASVPSYAQERRIRKACERGDGRPAPRAKTIPVVCRVPGPVDVAALEAAVRVFVRRHRLLRHRFTARGDRVAVHEVVDRADEIRCTVTRRADLPAQPGAEERFIRDEIDRPFDVLRWPLLRFGLVDSAQPVFYLCMDHLVTDGWSIFLAKAQIEELYGAVLTGRPARLGPAGDFFRHSGAERRRYADGPVLEEQIEAFQQLLGGRPVHPSCPVDGAAWNPGAGRYRRIHLLDPPAAAEFGRICRTAKSTVFMGLLAAYGVAVREATGREQAGVLVAMHNRDEARVRDSVGWYANMLPLYFPTADVTRFTEALRHVRAGLMALLDHHALPLSRIVDCLPADDYAAAGEQLPTCFMSFMDLRTPVRAAPAGPPDPVPVWERVEYPPSYRLGYGMWLLLKDDGLSAMVASPAEHGDGCALERFESTFAHVLHTVVAP